MSGARPDLFRTAVLVVALALTCGRAAETGTQQQLPGFRGVVEAHSHAREVVRSAFHYHPDLLCTSAAVHGPIRKAAAERPAQQLSGRSVRAYRASAIPVRKRNEVWVSDAHRFIYIRAHKAASTSVTEALLTLFCDGDVTRCDASVLRHQRGGVGDAGVWMDYFVFTFVRNPFTRLASAYTYFTNELRVVRTLKNGSRESGSQQCAGVEFPVFAANTESFVAHCWQTACCPATRDFYRPRSANLVDTHFNDQSHSVFNSRGDSMVDFIGRVEHFEDDWRELWDILGQRNGGRAYNIGPLRANAFGGERPAGSSHLNSCGADEFEAMYNETSMYDIAVQYALDFVRFGFPVRLNTTQGGTEPTTR